MIVALQFRRFFVSLLQGSMEETREQLTAFLNLFMLLIIDYAKEKNFRVFFRLQE